MLSTLHTNSAVESISRLHDMGIEPFLLSSSLVGIMAQRLVRKVCRDCAEPYVFTSRELEILEENGLEGVTQGKRGVVVLHVIIQAIEDVWRFMKSFQWIEK